MKIGSGKKRIYIIGAGVAGASLAREIASKPILGEVVVFLDDDRAKIGTVVGGIPVAGPLRDVVKIMKTIPADEAIIAIPSATNEQLKRIHEVVSRAPFRKVKILPRLSQILDNSAHLIQTRDLNPEDLLGRTSVRVSLKKSLSYLRGKRVLITGAGGSIGSELARQLLSGGAARLYLFGHGENSVYEIDRELRLLQQGGVGEKATVIPVIGELQDREYVSFLLKRLSADVIFHAAAHKHVPLLEENPVEAIKNNVFGTLNLVDAAREARTGRFVLISTDKAVEPVSVYGASKLLAEEIVLSADDGRSNFMVVRFGNVLGSRGSILPLFQRQIAAGGPVSLTHPEVRRFFMTIPEAVSLVLKAGGTGTGGELYVLDMGEPVLVRDLIHQLIQFYGYTPESDIKISLTGLRDGEKLEEKLFRDDEELEKTDFPKISKLIRAPFLRRNLASFLEYVRPICYFDPEQPELFRDRERLKTLLGDAVPSLQCFVEHGKSN
ncbi:MAG: polysaccharide biosynthesis protein [Spirochaetales bacterium]|nr:polysaccharide biosynthesis protein [Spirochaetales bacterium]